MPDRNRRQTGDYPPVAIFGCVVAMGLAITPLLAWAGEDAPLQRPPRTITDITAILDQQKPDPAARQRLLEAISVVPPATSESRKLAKFYFKRGRARSSLGFSPRQLEDYRKAYELAKKGKVSSRRFKSGLLVQLAVAEFIFGNRNKAILLLKERINAYANGYAVLISFLAVTGDLDAAEQWAKRAERYFKGRRKRRGSWVPFKQARWTGYLMEQRGRWVEAEASWRQALKALAQAEGNQDYPTLPFWFGRHVAIALKHQGRLVEAEVELRALLLGALAKFGKDSAVTAATIQDLAAVLGEQGRHEDAVTLLRIVVAILKDMEVSEDTVMLANARKFLGVALAIRGSWRGAAEQFEIARQGLVENRFLYRKWFINDVTFALTALQTGRPDAALASAREAHEALIGTLGEKHYLSAEAAGVLGMALAVAGQRAEALEMFGRAIPILLSRSRRTDDSGGGAAQAMRRRLILESYIALLAEIRGTDLEVKAGLDAAGEAFRLADVARAFVGAAGAGRQQRPGGGARPGAGRNRSRRARRAEADPRPLWPVGRAYERTERRTGPESGDRFAHPHRRVARQAGQAGRAHRGRVPGICRAGQPEADEPGPGAGQPARRRCADRVLCRGGANLCLGGAEDGPAALPWRRWAIPGSPRWCGGCAKPGPEMSRSMLKS